MPVTSFEIILRRVIAGGQSFGKTGPYEELKGTLYFVINPGNPANERITDVKLAPRNANGRVEFSSDLSILIPVDRRRGNGRIVLDVVNRGNRVTVPNFNRGTRPTFGPNSDPNPPIDAGDGFLMLRGYIIISCGWQTDLPDYPGLLRMCGPEALSKDGERMTGRIYCQFQSPNHVEHFWLANKGHRPCIAADLDEGDALMTVCEQPDGAATKIPRDRWQFAHVDGKEVISDPRYVHLKGGFEKGLLYQLTYTTVGAPVLGLSFAALRDAVSWMKYGSDAVHSPVSGGIQYAFAYGRSQSGRFLRTFLYNDLNLDEQGREALDGVIANVAGGMRGEFNQRFGQNSKDRNNMVVQLFPFADTQQTDPETGKTDSLHRRLNERGSPIKVFNMNSSSEYYRGDASLIHTDPDGKRDVAHGPNVRIYHITGTEHRIGLWPPNDSHAQGPDNYDHDRAQNLLNCIDYSPLLRAALVNMDRWVTEGIPPPLSKHPQLKNRTAVPPADLAPAFSTIPGSHFLKHYALPRRLDFGLNKDVEQTHTLPPRPGRPFGSLVSAVDADGNEVAGVTLPEVAIPLATFTGWNLRHPDIGGQMQLLVFAGSTIPFPKTRANRVASGDPRLSIEERYSSKDDYLVKVRAAGEALARQGYLLEDDIQLCVDRAEKMWNYFSALCPILFFSNLKSK